jgi:hypothetical protein
VETADPRGPSPPPPDAEDADVEAPLGWARPPASFWSAGGWLTWISGLVLMLSPFMGWYAGSGEGPTIAVTGWHTGVLGKLVFVLGAAVILLGILREFGFELPPAIPESLVIIVIGALATVFVLIRLISIPDRFFPSDGRSIGIWIALIAAIGVIVGGILRASEEL